MAVKRNSLQGNLEVEAASEFLKSFANPTRLRLLCALNRSELSVGALATAAGVPVVSASQQLANLRRDGLVAARRCRQTIYYRLADKNVSRFIEALTASFCPSRSARECGPIANDATAKANKGDLRDPDPTAEKGI
jgi:DNA-binding transcriptional ArsR family regulator